MSIPLEPRENRVKLFIVSERDVLMYGVADDSIHFDALRIGRKPKLPPGSKILRVSHDFARQAFLFLVYNAAFDSVPAWAMAPQVDGLCDVVDVVAIREDDGRYRIENVEHLIEERK